MTQPDAQIIQFSSFADRARPAKQANAADIYRAERLARRAAKLLEVTTAPETLTESCKNSRLRIGRRDAWWQAAYLTDYWRARLDWHSALSTAQSHNIADANSFPVMIHEERGPLVDQWRAALVKQILTQAPDMGAVNWKRTQLRGSQYKYTDVKPERLERAIADDIEWLTAHPTRKSIAAARQAQARKGE